MRTSEPYDASLRGSDVSETALAIGLLRAFTEVVWNVADSRTGASRDFHAMYLDGTFPGA
jgi:hypothetical protein